MFERFTERARQVVVLGQEECRHLHSEYIATSHLLIGMMRDEDSIAGRSLKIIDGFTVDDVRDFIGVGDTSDPISGQIPFTGSAKKLLDRSLREALSLGHGYIGSEHLLLALVDCPGEADEFLNRKLGNNWEEIIRLEVMELLRGPDGKTPAPSVFKDPVTQEAKDALEEDSLLKDILIGFKMWRDDKFNYEGLSDRDEAFVRWIEGSRAASFL